MICGVLTVVFCHELWVLTVVFYHDLWVLTVVVCHDLWGTGRGGWS